MGLIPDKDMVPFIEGLGEVVDDLRVVLVLSGSPETGLAVNLWTSIDGEGDAVEREAWRMVIHAAHESIVKHLG